MARLSGWFRQRSEAAAGALEMLAAILRAFVESWNLPESDRKKLADTLKHSSRGGILLGCIVVVVLLGLLESRVASKISFLFFYLLIVVLAGWTCGRKPAIFIAFVSSAASFLAAFRAPGDHPLTWAFCWNTAVQLGILLIAALMASTIHDLLMQEDKVMKERTGVLERDLAERGQTEAQLRNTVQQFRQLADNISDALWMRDAGELRMGYVSPAYEAIWGRTCRELYQSAEAWLDAVHAEDRDRVTRAMLSKGGAGEYNLEYRISRRDGAVRWIRDRAFPIRDASGKTIRVVGIAEDITVRRLLEREILEISDREQARIGQDLHDGLCQKLVSLAFDNNALEEKLAGKNVPDSAQVRRMGELLDDLINEARALSRGLFPVQLGTEGLGLALKQLAASTSARASVKCVVDCPETVMIHDDVIATHLYRIAQEAVNNALKHAAARNIEIRVSLLDDRLDLKVSDDGVGIPLPVGYTGGMGLHIMAYRARTIGGELNIQRRSGGGTLVCCSVRQAPAPRRT
jgi:PAS domain S-box-containing protein